jgi:hypothetical protein
MYQQICYVADKQNYGRLLTPKLAFVQFGTCFLNDKTKEEYIEWHDTVRTVLVGTGITSVLYTTINKIAYDKFDPGTCIYYQNEDFINNTCIRVMKQVKDINDPYKYDSTQYHEYDLIRELIYQFMYEQTRKDNDIDKSFFRVLKHVNNIQKNKEIGTYEMLYDTVMKEKDPTHRGRGRNRSQARQVIKKNQARNLFAALHGGRSKSMPRSARHSAPDTHTKVFRPDIIKHKPKNIIKHKPKNIIKHKPKNIIKHKPKNIIKHKVDTWRPTVLRKPASGRIHNRVLVRSVALNTVLISDEESDFDEESDSFSSSPPPPSPPLIILE